MSAQRSLVSTLSLSLALHLLSPGAFAQTGAGSLTGIVADQSGAKVPGATVTATNQATNVASELSGFKTATTNPIQVEAVQQGEFPSAARDINWPNTFGQITQTLSTATVSTARTMELVFKFFF